MYSYAGSDGKWHSADLGRLKEWAQQGYVEPYAPVIETATGRQTRADAIPELQPIFAARFEARAKQGAEADAAAAATLAAQSRNRKKGTYWTFGTAMVVMITLSVVRSKMQDKQLPLVMPPATPGAVPAPDLAEAGKFMGRWQCTQQIHQPNRETTRSSDLAIQPGQTLLVTLRTYSVSTASDGHETSSRGSAFSLQWSQQKDAQGRRLWVVRHWPSGLSRGLYYRFDNAGNVLSLTGASAGASTSTGTASLSSQDEDGVDLSGVYTRVPVPRGLQPVQMRRRDMDAKKGRALQ